MKYTSGNLTKVQGNEYHTIKQWKEKGYYIRNEHLGKSKKLIAPIIIGEEVKGYKPFYVYSRDQVMTKQDYIEEQNKYLESLENQEVKIYTNNSNQLELLLGI